MITEIQLDEKRERLMNSKGNLLVMGGPGSGKTTIALLKADNECKKLKPYQKILFLSFARATVTRVLTQCKNIIPKENMKHIEINTYHAFVWSLLKANCKLVSTHPISLLLPHEAAAMFSGMDEKELKNAIYDTFEQTGRLHFDLFAPKAAELLSNSCAIRKIISDVYPIIILDEFQDTNLDEWNMVMELGKNSTLIALADPEQRIYDFRGASPERIKKYIDVFSPEIFDFGVANNRSAGTDIVQFGNDLLDASNKGKTYNDVCIIKYIPQYSKSEKHIRLKSVVLNIIKSLSNDSNEWSVAILTPSNSLMVEVSDYLFNKQEFRTGVVLPALQHNVLIDMTGPTLSAILIAYLMESGSQNTCNEKVLLKHLVKHIAGKKNGVINQKDKALCEALEKYMSGEPIRGKNRLELINACQDIVKLCNLYMFSGDIVADWKYLRSLLNYENIESLMNVYEDSFHVRLLRKGSMLFSDLSALWQNAKNYSGAINVFENAFAYEHFSSENQSFSGVNVMTVHKSKGKEFDVVIVYEGVYNGRICTPNISEEQARLNLRVAVTRARKKVIILTPQSATCELL